MTLSPKISHRNYYYNRFSPFQEFFKAVRINLEANKQRKSSLENEILLFIPQKGRQYDPSWMVISSPPSAPEELVP
jgi:hypothetical protein